MRRRRLILLLLSALAWPWAAAGASALNSAADPAATALQRTVVADGLRFPWGLAFLSENLALVTEKEGGLVLVDLASGRKTPVAGMPTDIDRVRRDPRDNSGLFDVALHPEFARNGLLFLAYASREGEGAAAPTTTKLVRARLVAAAEAPRLEALETVFTATPRTTERFHYGGGLSVANGWLYLTVGERHYFERDNPPLPVAQDPRDLRGKIYRFRLDEARPRPQPVAMGIRAAQGMAVQPGSGRIWFSEHGSRGGDELNILAPGANYGWPYVSHGTYREGWRPPALPAGVRVTPPVFYWADRTVAPTGLTFLSGRHPDFAAWRGDLLVAGLSRGYLMRVDVEDDRVVAVDYLLEDAPVRLRNVREAPDGRVYILTDEANGKLIRLGRSRGAGS